MSPWLVQPGDPEAALAAEAQSDPQRPDRREERACKRCGFVRIVKITDVRTGTRHGNNYIFKITGESFANNCHACDLELNADKYDRLASVNRKRAADERGRQAMRRLKPFRVPASKAKER